MTNNDAITIIKAGGWGYPENMVTEANLMAIEALEKRTPKKLVQQGYYPSCCPSCGGYLDDEILFITDVNYCPVCGQAFDWSEVE